MRICVVILAVLLLVFASPKVSAENRILDVDEFYNIDQLLDSLEPDTRALLRDTELTGSNKLSDALFSVLYDTADSLVGTFRSDVSLMAKLCGTVVVCSIAGVLCGTHGNISFLYAGALGIVAISIKDIQSMMSVGKNALFRLNEFLSALSPIMATVSTASGSGTSAGVNYALTVFFSNILVRLSTNMILPGIYAYISLAFIDAVSMQERLKSVKKLTGSSIEWMLKGVVYAFIGCLAVSGVLTGAADAAKVKATKAALSAMIPVVGGILSGAADTVLAGAALAKNAIGSFGVIAIFAIVLTPFFRLSMKWLLLKLVTAICQIMFSSLGGLLESISKAMGYLLAMTGSSAVVALLSCCCYLKVVHV